jgi:preprotein translocase subunit SecF
MQIFTKPNYNFIRWRWHAIALSLIVIGAGLFYMWSMGGMPLGIDFKGGSIIILKFEQAVHEDAVRAALEKMPGEKVVSSTGRPARDPRQAATEHPAREGGRSPRT